MDQDAFPDCLITAYRHLVVHVRLISVLDETAQKLVQAGTLEHSDERHSTIWESEGSGAYCVEFQRRLTMQGV